MTQSIWQITIREKFSSAHALRHYNGKCERLHGHNYAVEMVVEGDTLSDDTHLLTDFTILKKILRAELENLDHCNLNAIAPFSDMEDKVNPSSENIARYIWQQMKPKLAHLPVNLYSISVSEKPEQTATYREISR